MKKDNNKPEVVEGATGDKEWYLNGEELTEEEHAKRTS